MPIYEFVCPACKAELELLVRVDENPACPNCNNPKLEKQLSVIAAPNAADRGRQANETCTMPRCCGGGCQSL